MTVVTGAIPPKTIDLDEMLKWLGYSAFVEWAEPWDGLLLRHAWVR